MTANLWGEVRHVVVKPQRILRTSSKAHEGLAGKPSMWLSLGAHSLGIPALCLKTPSRTVHIPFVAVILFLLFWGQESVT